jgi:hypothetical protein
MPELSFSDECVMRHWCPKSEKYMGGDALLTLIENHWQPCGTIFRQEVLLGGCRRVYVYHVNLSLDTESMRVAILDNPAVRVIIAAFGTQVVQLNEYINLRRSSQMPSASEQGEQTWAS